MELDETLTSREVINTKMRASLDVATDPWGIKVNRVELKNIIPPAAIQDAMEKQMKAERERKMCIRDRHYADIYDIDEEVAGKAMKLAKKLAGHMTEVLGCDGFNILQNNQSLTECP